MIARAELRDGLRSIPSDGVSLAFFPLSPCHYQEKEREECLLEPPNRLALHNRQ